MSTIFVKCQLSIDLYQLYYLNISLLNFLPFSSIFQFFVDIYYTLNDTFLKLSLSVRLVKYQLDITLLNFISLSYLTNI